MDIQDDNCAQVDNLEQWRTREINSLESIAIIYMELS